MSTSAEVQFGLGALLKRVVKLESFPFDLAVAFCPLPKGVLTLKIEAPILGQLSKQLLRLQNNLKSITSMGISLFNLSPPEHCLT